MPATTRDGAAALVRRGIDAASSPSAVIPPHYSSSSFADLLSVGAESPSSMTSSWISTAVAGGNDVVAYDAIMPNTAVLASMGFVVLLCVVAGYVWANDVVPISRTKLAISKNRGGELVLCVWVCVCGVF